MGLLYALEGIRTSALSAFLAAITYLGSELTFIAAAIIVFWCVDKKRGYYLMATGLIGTTVNQFIKILCRVPRPWVRDPRFTIVESARAEATGYSFPSGHTQNVTSIFGGVAYTSKRRAVRIVCIAVVALVAFSRMYLGVHYPTDVLVGLVCGVALVVFLWPVFKHMDEKPAGPVVVFAAGAVLSLAAALYVERRAWPADTDPANLATAVSSLYMMFCCLLAVAVALPIERRYIRFDPKAPWWAQLLKTIVGLGCVMALRVGLKPLLAAALGPAPIAYGVRYGIMVLFAVLVWPLTFSWFSRGCRRRAKREEEEA